MVATEAYQEGSSFLHRRDARAKLIAFILLVVCTVTADWRHLGRLGLCAAALALLLFAGRVAPLPLLRRSLLVLPFLLVPAVSAPFLEQTAHTPAWIVVAVVGLRAWLAALLLLALMACTRYADLLDGAARLGVPRILVSLGSFLYRYVFVLTEEAGRMLQARDLRLGGRGALVAGSRVAGTMVASLFLHTWGRAERIHQCMLARGFEGVARRTGPRALATGDWALLAATATLAAAALCLG